LRKKLNLKEEEEVIFEVQGNNLVMTSLKHTLHKARQTIKRYHVTDEKPGEKLSDDQEEVINHE
jgi:bifunctional DNA-binding transcriptional regulator/antitoxin component of YhaV-PrlF toxin-antitoxin module